MFALTTILKLNIYFSAARSNWDASDDKCHFQERDMVELLDCQHGHHHWFRNYACTCLIWRRDQNLSQQLTDLLQEQTTLKMKYEILGFVNLLEFSNISEI